MYLIHTPTFIQNMFPNFIWRVESDDPVLYLTFDDGPIPEVTPWVLDQLRKYNAEATFFCVGDNVLKYPQIFSQIREEGHAVGSHTQNHISGWANENVPYFHNVRKCAELVDSNLFRPPYGKIKPKQAQFLMRHYQIVMWDVLSADFDTSISPQKCLDNVLRTAKAGSVIVMHDSLKAKENIEYALPKILEHFSEEGFRFRGLPAESLSSSHKLRRTA